MTGDGIDFRALKNGQDTEFEIKPQEEEEDNFNWEDENDKIDYEKIFRFRNIDMIGQNDQDEEVKADSNNNQEPSGNVSKTPFEALKVKMFDVTPEQNGGVVKRKIMPGEGSHITKGARVRSKFPFYHWV